MEIDKKTQRQLDVVNRELKAVFDQTVRDAEAKISRADDGYGKGAFIRAMGWLVGRCDQWNQELGERMHHLGFLSYEHFECTWNSHGMHSGHIVFSLWNSGAANKMVYRIPAWNRNGYELRRPDLAQVKIDEDTFKVNATFFDNAYDEAKEYLRCATDLPNPILRVVDEFMNFTNRKIMDDLDALAGKYGIHDGLSK